MRILAGLFLNLIVAGQPDDSGAAIQLSWMQRQPPQRTRLSIGRTAFGLCGSSPRIRAAPHDCDVPLAAAGRSIDGYRLEHHDWARLRRFLVLGSEGGSYYAGEFTLTRENAQAVERSIHEDGPRAVSEISRVSEEGQAPKNDPALFALAMAAGLGDEPTRRAALEALPRVARTGTHLFEFATFVEQFRGWGVRCAGRWAAGTPAERFTRSLTRRSSTASVTA